MKSIISTLIVLGLSATAMAGIGSAKISAHDFGIYFNYDLNGSELTGYSNHGGSQVIRMENSNGTWTGRFGVNHIESKPVVYKSDSEIEVTLESVLTGRVTYKMKWKSNGDLEFNALLNSGDVSRGYLKDSGEKYIVGTFDQSISLEKRNDGKYYGKWTYSYAFGMKYSDVTLTAKDDLDLVKLAKQDPALFLTLFVLPFH